MSTLNEKAAAIFCPGARITLRGDGGVNLGSDRSGNVRYFDDDLNDAAELWERASQEVRDGVEMSIMKKNKTDLDCIDATWRLFTNPAALTAAIVEAHESIKSD